MKLNIGNDWDEILDEETDKPYFGKLVEFLTAEYESAQIYPPKSLIFSALKYVPFADAKVVIVGQDPYINEGQANGLAFAVGTGTKLPPSLKNIYKELSRDLNVDLSGKGGELTGWARQGVMLLNSTLTVRSGLSNAHSDSGWQEFTDFIIKKLGARDKPLVFILWGAFARRKCECISSHHCIIASSHPSPMSVNQGFFGSRPFSRANEFLKSVGVKEIDWANITDASNCPSQNIAPKKELPFYYNNFGSIIKSFK